MNNAEETLNNNPGLLDIKLRMRNPTPLPPSSECLLPCLRNEPDDRISHTYISVLAGSTHPWIRQFCSLAEMD